MYWTGLDLGSELWVIYGGALYHVLFVCWIGCVWCSFGWVYCACDEGWERVFRIYHGSLLLT